MNERIFDRPREVDRGVNFAAFQVRQNHRPPSPARPQVVAIARIDLGAVARRKGMMDFVVVLQSQTNLFEIVDAGGPVCGRACAACTAGSKLC